MTKGIALCSISILLIIPFIGAEAQTDSQKEKIVTNNWHHLSYASDSIFGINTIDAYHFLASTKRVPQEIVVAILDAGVDIYHEDLSSNIWTNKKEITNNNIDDDHNGYIDDIHGWNFLGGKSDTINLMKAGTEEFREYKRLRPQFEHIKEEGYMTMTDEEQQQYEYFLHVRDGARIPSYLNFVNLLSHMAKPFLTIDSLMLDQFGEKETQLRHINELELDSSFIPMYEIVMDLTKSTDSYENWNTVYETNIAEYLLAKERVSSLDSNFSPRDLIGDNLENINDRYYGNNAVNIDADHGTFAAGIIAAIRGNGKGIDGIADKVKIMTVRAVPDGDEYDKDIALGIRYAVDNGAKIINMSFGKYLSPHSQWVDEAIQYATQNNVLMIQAAGNNSLNLDSVPYFPSGYIGTDRKKSESFIRVGASTAKGEISLISNYGKNEVDLLAPGEDIYSLVSNNQYKTLHGTSISTPMVAGVAALIWSYFPELKAAELKNILLKSVEKRENTLVDYPTDRGVPPIKGRFEDLSVSGGILNAYNAVKEAEDFVENNR